MESSDYETDILLKRLEFGVYTQFFVLLFAFFHMVPFKLDNVAVYTKQCETYEEATINNGFFGDTQVARDMDIMVSGNELKLPVAMALALSYGTGFSVEAVDRLPCGFNFQGASQTLLDSRISDSRLRIETKEFINQCYQPALNRALRYGDTNIPWVDNPRTESQPWPGHQAFMNDAYYGNVGSGFYSNVLLPGWQASRTNTHVSHWIESQQQESRGEVDCSDGQCMHQLGGFPSCREWWQGIGAGYSGFNASNNELSLRSRLWAHLPDEDKNKIWPLLKASYSDGSDTWYQDKLLEKAYFSKVAISRIQNAEMRDYGLQGEGFWGTTGSWINRLLGTTGNVATAVPEYAAASLVQLAAPMIKGAILMVLVVAWPLVAMISQYSLKMMTMMTALVVSVLFWPFLWELTIVVQKSYIETVANSSQIPLVDLLTNPNMMLISQRLTDALFITFPVMVTSLLTMAGLSIGGAIKASGGLGDGGSSAGKTGAKVGGKFAGKIASKGIK